MLNDWGMKYRIQVCKMGGMVFTVTRTFHQVINVGANILESISFIFPHRVALTEGVVRCSKSRCGNRGFRKSEFHARADEVSTSRIAVQTSSRKRKTTTTTANARALKRRKRVTLPDNPSTSAERKSVDEQSEDDNVISGQCFGILAERMLLMKPLFDAVTQLDSL